MNTTLSILSFVKARRGPKARWVYGYVADSYGSFVSVRHDSGIKPVTDVFPRGNIESISEDTFWSKTEGSTALHSQYWDAKKRNVHDPRVESSPERHDLRNQGLPLEPTFYMVRRLSDGLWYNPDLPGNRVDPTFHRTGKRYYGLRGLGNARRTVAFCTEPVNVKWSHRPTKAPVQTEIVPFFETVTEMAALKD